MKPHGFEPTPAQHVWLCLTLQPHMDRPLATSALDIGDDSSLCRSGEVVLVWAVHMLTDVQCHKHVGHVRASANMCA